MSLESKLNPCVLSGCWEENHPSNDPLPHSESRALKSKTRKTGKKKKKRSSFFSQLGNRIWRNCEFVFWLLSYSTSPSGPVTTFVKAEVL